MPNAPSTPLGELVGRTAIDNDGAKVGKIVAVYPDNDIHQPEWLAIATGLSGTTASFVPIGDATLVDDDVQIPFSKDQVKAAPQADPNGELSAQEEDVLYAHYGRQTDAPGADATLTAPSPDTAATTGPATDDAMTRSEEQLDVSTSTRQTGTARLHKWIETEDVHIVVPVRREMARLIVEPVTGGGVEGADISEDEQVVTLSEEVVDVSKHVVAKERVRLETDVEIDEVVVDEQVRKERVALDADADAHVDDGGRS